ncbi:small multi-drug export protein [Candidatus Woesearchaeota archaeon]|nr:small multi-drug export protein [Candidatus Woesearchaeota archaeon]
MLKEIIVLMLLTFLPFLELRYSIPAGILAGSITLPFGIVLNGLGLNWVLVFFVAVVTNIALGILVYFLLDKFVHYFLRFKIFSTPYEKIIIRSQKKIKKYVDKYGEIGVAIFIGIPLPGSGVYTGALGAYAIGLEFKKFIIASIIGVIIAGVAVTTITLIGIGIFGIL